MSNWSSFELLNLCEIQFYTDHLSPCQLFDGWPWELLLLIYGWRYGWKMPKVKFIFYGFIYLFLKKSCVFRTHYIEESNKRKQGIRRNIWAWNQMNSEQHQDTWRNTVPLLFHIQVFVIVLYWLPEKFHYSWMLMEFSLSSFFISSFYFYTLLVY